MDSKIKDKFQTILNTKKWSHKFLEKKLEMNIIEQSDHKTKKREKLSTIHILTDTAMARGKIIMISTIIISLLLRTSTQSIRPTMRTMVMTDIYKTSLKM